jgi:enterochelin esterase-like enzyme
MSPFRSSGRYRVRVFFVSALAFAAVFLAVGFVGVGRYGKNYWLYRGFPPPTDPGYVKQRGKEERIAVTSAALAGRSQQVYVYLPPGYSGHPTKRYPVLYLLHGFPGRPLAFLLTVRLGIVEDELYAKWKGQPVILVMPFGSTGTFTDKEWADGVGTGEEWATFVSRDLVEAIDARFRTVAAPAGRAIAGLSEGGYGAVNIALHNPGEFKVVESWSGYERAAHIRSIFGRDLESIAANSPLDTLRAASPELRRAHVYLWFYSGQDDPLHVQNREFAAELKRLHVAHRYLVFRGGHNWALWRGQATRELLVVMTRLTHA